MRCAISKRFLWSVAFVFALLAASSVAAVGDARADPSSALDAIPREIDAAGPMPCPSVALVDYRGDVLPYDKPLRVYVGFRERLARFEAVVQETALDVYGRAPRAIRHSGGYTCRRIAAWPTLLSEHALGNAIDINGFSFGPASDEARKKTPRHLRRGFEVTVRRHWSAKRPADTVHQRFLRRLTQRLVAAGDIFRVLLGPSYPGHKGHFHFDAAPYRLVVL